MMVRCKAISPASFAAARQEADVPPAIKPVADKDGNAAPIFIFDYGVPSPKERATLIRFHT